MCQVWCQVWCLWCAITSCLSYCRPSLYSLTTWTGTKPLTTQTSTSEELSICVLLYCYNLCVIYRYMHIIGASLSKPHTSVTTLRTCVCMLACLLACLDRPLTVNFKWAYSNISQRSILWRPVEASGGQWRPDCQSAVSATWSKDDWSWCTRGNLILVCASTDDDGPLAVQIWTVGRAMQTVLKRQECSLWFRCRA